MHKETSKWVRDLCLVNSEIAQDMAWVQEQWLKRGEELARDQKSKKRTRIGSTWTKKSRKAEQQRVADKSKLALEEHHPTFKNRAQFAYSKQLGWIAHFGVIPDNWEQELGPLGWVGCIMTVGGVNRLWAVRRIPAPKLAPGVQFSAIAL